MRLRFFGRLRDVMGDAREVTLPADVTDSDTFRAWVGRENPELVDPSVRIALDDRMLTGCASLAEVEEISFLPPVSGG